MKPPIASRPTRTKTPTRRIVGWLIKAVLAFLLLSLLWVLLYKIIAPPITATMLGDENGASRDWRPIADIDPDMARAIIAAEDAKFCAHSGFDLDAIEDAWSRYRAGGRIRGGSTISQQTAKNAFLWQNGGFFRKSLEVWFTFLIEQLWGKRRIMEVYLNVAETGIGTYGVEAGSQRYFDHGADRMTPTQAARIAAVLPLPKARGAVAPTGFTRRYGNSILARMAVVRREGLDDCLGLQPGAPADDPTPRRSSAKTRGPAAALEAVVPPPDIPAAREENMILDEAPLQDLSDDAPIDVIAQPSVEEPTDPDIVVESPPEPIK